MIHVSKLTKYYGDYAAIQDVSFDVPTGKIVGFLGPNGAGKSTTMRILAGFLTATSGKATIDGLDVFWNPVEARRRIGYMPENCPLYQEMRVGEYLRFRAGIKGMHGRNRKTRIEFVVGRCSLAEVQRQIIGTLSRGFRQRVGLADALLASPPVLILDEPTAGLDPTQIRSARSLIRELGQEHTILLSTHILPEVEMTCDSVIIINRGKVAAADSLAALTQQAGAEACLIAHLEGEVTDELLQKVPGLTGFVREKPAPVAGQGAEPNLVKLRLQAPDMNDLASRLCYLATLQGWGASAVHPERRTLEDLFVQITGRTEG